jgi:hypothetical protein
MVVLHIASVWITIICHWNPNAKSAFIQRTADDLSSVIRRAPYSEVLLYSITRLQV